MDSHEYIGEETEVLTQQRKVISFVATLVTIILIRCRYRLVRTIERAPLSKRVSQRNDYLNMVIYESDDTCLNMFRMKRELFFRFCQELRNKGLRNRGDVSVEEQVAMFLQIVGHNIKNRVIKTNFIRSGQTVSRYFCDVLFAVGELRGDYLKLPNAETSDYIKKNRRFTPFFDNCIGAIDGTHIPATPPPDNIGAFRGRKGVTQNVLAAVDFDLRFLYVLAGYEGSAHDAIVLANALEREDGSIPIIEEKYYLADAGYSTRPGFITPFRGMRYHLSEFSNNPPANDKELFNHWHSCLRTVIERAFGALKFGSKF